MFDFSFSNIFLSIIFTLIVVFFPLAIFIVVVEIMRSRKEIVVSKKTILIFTILNALFGSIIFTIACYYFNTKFSILPIIFWSWIVYKILKSQYGVKEPDSSLNEEPEQEEEEAPEPDISDIKEDVTEIADSENTLNTQKEESLNKKSIKKTPYIIAISILSVALIASVTFSIYKIKDDNNAIAELQKQSSEYKNTNAELESEIADKDKQLEDYNYLQFQYSQIKAFTDYKLSGKISKDIVVDDVLVLKKQNGSIEYKINYIGEPNNLESFGELPDYYLERFSSPSINIYQKGNSIKCVKSAHGYWYNVSNPLKITPVKEGITILYFEIGELYRAILVIVI